MLHNAWLGDPWCDDNCRIYESCGYDEDDCSACDNNCEHVFDIFQIITGGEIVITEDYACEAYYLVNDLAPQIANNSQIAHNYFIFSTRMKII